jgi:hypothetical protein
MAWQIPKATDVMNEFTPSERDTITKICGNDPDVNANVQLTNILAFVVDEIRDYIRSGGYQVDPDSEDTIPKGLFNDAISIARWRFLVSAPQFKQLQTDERKQLYTDAVAKLDKIAATNYVPDPVDDTVVNRAGMWNSENKLIMRTHPVPSPGTQFTPQQGAYANPDAPQDIGTPQP